MYRDIGWAFLGIAGFAAAWLAWPGSALLPSLGEVLSQAWHLLLSGQLLRDIASSVIRVALGVTLAFAVASAFGGLAAFCRPVGRVLLGVSEILRPVPPIAWTPVAILIFGVGDQPAVAIVCLGAFFPIWLGYVQGIDAVRSEHLQAAKSLGASKLQVIALIVAPSILPFVLHGLRLGVGLGWFCVVAAEMMGASSGLGHGIQLFSLNIQMEAVFTYLMLIGLLGAGFNASLAWLEKQLTFGGRAVEF